MALALGGGCSKPPAAGEFDVGATREALRDAFGEPMDRQEFHKTSAGIAGPIEDFWSRVPLYSTVEVWTYRVEGGTVELYFIDGSERVLGTGFAPQGAVFEAKR